MSKPKLSLNLGLLALMSWLSLTESRPYHHPDDVGTYIGPHEFQTDELGTFIGPHEHQTDELGTFVGPHEYQPDELGTIIGPHTYPEDLETVLDIDNFPDSGKPVHRRDFPDDFIFGTSVSSFQVEGAKARGRGLTTWDEFTHMFPDKVANHDGDIAIDFYNRYKDDIKLMKDLNTNGFRFSISWARILPFGRESEKSPVNEEGVEFYNNLINELIANGIQPAITLFHWELPLALEMEYKGFLDRRIVEDFRNFARICFEKFGDRVKNWATFNEPSVYSVAGYSKGKKAPGRCSQWMDGKCQPGDSSLEPYIVAHHEILAHLAAVEEFNKCDKCKEGGGKIGIVLVSHWFEPLGRYNGNDGLARHRSLEFLLGWFMHPLTHGRYPPIMEKTVKNRLPKFTEEESQRLKDNPLDFVGLNYYGTFFVTHDDKANLSLSSYHTDLRTNWTTKQPESPHLKVTSMNIVIYPKGLRDLLKYIKDNYNDPEIYIMENGMDEFDNGTKTLDEALDDFGRAQFIRSHIMILAKSIRTDHVKVKGYFIWSLVDNFEWQLGYNTRFGLYYVDYNNGLKRHMRKSGEWLRDFLSDKKPPLDICYFESHREKGHPPDLFPKEIYDPDEFMRAFARSYLSDFI